MHEFASVDSAKWFAIGAHGQQKRKYTGEPYWVHLENVYRILTNHFVNIDSYMVAWLHDVVEDTEFTILHITEYFGPRIAKYVDEITEPTGKNREERKQRYNEQLANASPLVQTVKYADLLDNTLTIEAYDPDFAKVYLSEKRVLLPMINKGDPVLYKMACEQVGL